MREGAPAVGAVGACSRSKNCGNVARKFSNACKFEVLRKRLFKTSFLMFAISSTNMSYASALSGASLCDVRVARVRVYPRLRVHRIEMLLSWTHSPADDDLPI